MEGQYTPGVILLTKFDLYIKIIISMNKTDNYIDIIFLFNGNQDLIDLVNNIFKDNKLQFVYVRDIEKDQAKIYESKILRNYDYISFLKQLNDYLKELHYSIKIEM